MIKSGGSFLFHVEAFTRALKLRKPGLLVNTGERVSIFLSDID